MNLIWKVLNFVAWNSLLVFQIFCHLVQVFIFGLQLIDSLSHLLHSGIVVNPLARLFNIIKQRIFFFFKLGDAGFQFILVWVVVGYLGFLSVARLLLDFEIMGFALVHLCFFNSFLGFLTSVVQVLIFDGQLSFIIAGSNWLLTNLTNMFGSYRQRVFRVKIQDSFFTEWLVGL